MILLHGPADRNQTGAERNWLRSVESSLSPAAENIIRGVSVKFAFDIAAEVKSVSQ
jgi:hypothetical protein